MLPGSPEEPPPLTQRLSRRLRPGQPSRPIGADVPPSAALGGSAGTAGRRTAVHGNAVTSRACDAPVGLRLPRLLFQFKRVRAGRVRIAEPAADRRTGCSARVRTGQAGCLVGEAGGGGGVRAALLSSRSVAVPGQRREPGDSSRGRGRWTRGPARAAGLNFTQGAASACPAWPHTRDFPCEPAGREVRRGGHSAALSR